MARTFSVHWPKLAFQTLYSGPQGFVQGLNEFVQGLAANLQNPYAKTFPDSTVGAVQANSLSASSRPRSRRVIRSLSVTTAR